MQDSLETVTLGALASRLSVERSALGSEQRLVEDWHLRPAELVLVALEVADRLGRVMTFDALAAIRTVGDFVALVRSSPTDDEAFEGKPVESLWSVIDDLSLAKTS